MPAHTKSASDPLHALFVLTLTSGLRQGEALALTWDDLDFEASTLSVQRNLVREAGTYRFAAPKTERSRRVLPLSNTAVTALRRHRASQRETRLAGGPTWNPDGLVFVAPSGGPLDGSTVTRHFQRALAAAGLPRITFHDLRHSCASLMLANGVSPRVVMEQLGHSDIRLTMNTYTHVIPSLQVEAAERIDAMLAAEEVGA